MEQVKYAILGIVQGITEFFPVSSSGHLAIAHRILGVGADLGFDTAVHLGTGLAVVIFYFRELLVYAADAFSSTVRFKGRRNSWDSIGGGRLLLLLVITSLPAAFAGFLLQDKVEAAFSSPWAVSVFLCVTGFVLILASRGREGRITKPAQTTAQVALIVGLSQAIALFPGISRSGMTIAAGLMCGFTAQWAIDYSMMASLPVIIGAFLLQAAQGSLDFSGVYGLNAGIGIAASLITGLFAIALLKKLAVRRKLAPFAIWVFIAAAANIVLNLTTGI
jgi:undecaprenyl-diphosphatase